MLFNRVLPEQVQFVNEKLDKGGVKDLIAEVYELCGQEVTTDVADAIKSIGFEYATKSGTTLAVADISIPPERKGIIEEALKAVEVVLRDFRRGLLTEQEKNEREIQIWQETTEKVGDAVKKTHGSRWQSFHHGNLRRDQRWFLHHLPVGGYAWFDG